MKKVAIVDYGVGNVNSIMNIVKYVGASAIVTNDERTLLGAEKVILPGVGSYDAALRRLIETDLYRVIIEIAMGNQANLLGICLGMQLLMEGSDEGTLKGLGLIKGWAHAFRASGIEGLRVPHMGWANVQVVNPNCLISGDEGPQKFYFAHSYYVKVRDRSDAILTCNNGVEFDAGVMQGNIMGVQFHPEKSHKYGMQLFRNFLTT